MSSTVLNSSTRRLVVLQKKKFELPGTKSKTSTGFEPMTSGPIVTNADLTVKTTPKFERVNYVSKNCNSALDIILVFKTQIKFT